MVAFAMMAGDPPSRKPAVTPKKTLKLPQTGRTSSAGRSKISAA
jgi:hypothetical protein